MDINDYRHIQSRILFSLNGMVPDVQLYLDNDERDALLDRLSRCSGLIDTCSIHGHQLPIPDKPTNTERWASLKRWFLSHHLFITQLALTAYCLKEATPTTAIINDANLWARLASRLRKGCGALFLYSIDFKPCAPLYSCAIRSDMPTAFSGFWIRERQHYFQPALVRFLRSFECATQDKFDLSPRNNWEAADRRYHELHERSMYEAVPDGRSLSAQYREENGKPHRITDEQFRHYDTWFCIERKADLSRLDYIFQTCDLIERAVADLMSGHRLEASVLNELLDGWKAALAVFGNWAGPVPQQSKFYPRYLRGE